MTVSFVGGDERALAAARRLRERGCAVRCAGLSLLHPIDLLCTLPNDAVTSADAVVLPLPYTKDAATLYAPFSATPMKASGAPLGR